MLTALLLPRPLALLLLQNNSYYYYVGNGNGNGVYGSRSNCQDYNGWAVAVGAISTALCLIFAIMTCWSVCAKCIVSSLQQRSQPALSQHSSCFMRPYQCTNARNSSRRPFHSCIYTTQRLSLQLTNASALAHTRRSGPAQGWASKGSPFLAIFLVILWIPGAFVTTFDAPFTFVGNGYYSAWAAFFFSLLFCQQVGLAQLTPEDQPAERKPVGTANV